MLQHLSRQHLMDQLVRSVEQCEYERRTGGDEEGGAVEQIRQGH
jgi:hypothetical protein